jgi:hypothetical protein
MEELGGTCYQIDRRLVAALAACLVVRGQFCPVRRSSFAVILYEYIGLALMYSCIVTTTYTPLGFAATWRGGQCCSGKKGDK